MALSRLHARFYKGRPKNPVHYRVPRVLGWILIAVAVVADAIQVLLKLLVLIPLLLILGEVVSWLTYGFCVITFGIIFAFRGVNFLSGRHTASKLARFVFMFLVECLPVLNAVPAMTIWVYLTVRESHKEDELQAEDKSKEEQVRDAKMKRRQLLSRRHLRAIHKRAAPRFKTSVKGGAKGDKPPSAEAMLRRRWGIERDNDTGKFNYVPQTTSAIATENRASTPYTRDVREREQDEATFVTSSASLLKPLVSQKAGVDEMRRREETEYERSPESANPVERQKDEKAKAQREVVQAELDRLRYGARRTNKEIQAEGPKSSAVRAKERTDHELREERERREEEAHARQNRIAPKTEEGRAHNIRPQSGPQAANDNKSEKGRTAA